MNKVVRDGKVAVLVAPGFGAGWSTWNGCNPAVVFDPETVEWVLAGKPEDKRPNWEERFERFYDGGAEDLVVEWLPVGTAFIINEYDGSESIDVREEIRWMIA